MSAYTEDDYSALFSCDERFVEELVYYHVAYVANAKINKMIDNHITNSDDQIHSMLCDKKQHTDLLVNMINKLRDSVANKLDEIDLERVIDVSRVYRDVNGRLFDIQVSVR